MLSFISHCLIIKDGKVFIFLVNTTVKNNLFFLLNILFCSSYGNFVCSSCIYSSRQRHPSPHLEQRHGECRPSVNHLSIYHLRHHKSKHFCCTSYINNCVFIFSYSILKTTNSSSLSRQHVRMNSDLSQKKSTQTMKGSTECPNSIRTWLRIPSERPGKWKSLGVLCCQ